MGVGVRLRRRFDFGGLGFSTSVDDVVDISSSLSVVVGLAGEIDLVAVAAAAGEADVGSRASPGPLTTQPMIESVIGVVMCASRFSSISTVLMTLKPWRAQDGQTMMLTPRWRRPSDFRMSKPTLISSTGSADSETRMRVADAGPEQRADADGRLDGAADQAAGLGDAEMERTVDGLGQLLVGRDRRGTRPRPSR